MEQPIPPDPPTFHLFPHLPPELRTQIWRAALPAPLGPALFPYRRGLWRPRRLPPDDAGYDAANDELNLAFEFRTDLLPRPGLRAARSLALACREARGVVARARGGGSGIFARAFDAARDALYVGSGGAWDELVREPPDRQFEADLVGRNVDVEPWVLRVAVAEGVLRGEVGWLRELFAYYYRVRSLLVVVGPQPGGDTEEEMEAGEGGGEPRWWEYESVGEGAWVWDGSSHDGFQFRGVRWFADRALTELIAEICMELGRVLVEEHIYSFEVRAVRAVER